MSHPPTDAALTKTLQCALGTDTLAPLNRRLTQQAEREGILDLAYRVVESPVGDLLVVTSTAGLVRLAFDLEGHDDVLAALADEISPRLLASAARTDEVARELDEYFEGQRHQFEVPVDYRLSRGFRLEILRHLVDIAYGATASYGDIARAAGNPRAARAVGSACANNPVPIVVPCHRVIRSGGSLGNYLGAYLGGPDVKVTLLELEGAI